MNIWAIVILVMAVSYLIQMVLDRRISKYSQFAVRLSGAEVAQKMLREHGINNVTVTCIGGKLTDHFDPAAMTVNLSEAVYSGRNVAAAAIAAHECGHAVQHASAYAPLRMRSWMVPVVSIANRTVQWVLLLGVLAMSVTPYLLYFGIALFALTTLFSFITLPVEINASRRAVEWLDMAGITDFETAPMARDALKWAAYTYVIAALGSLATLLYYIGIARRN